MLQSLPRLSQPSTPRTAQAERHHSQMATTAHANHLAPDANDFLAAYALAKPARGKFGRLALFGHRFTARHCGSRGSRKKNNLFFCCLKRVRSCLNGLEASPGRCAGSCRRLTTSARRLRAWKCQEPRSSVYLVGGGVSWTHHATSRVTLNFHAHAPSSFHTLPFSFLAFLQACAVPRCRHLVSSPCPSLRTG